MAAPWRTHFSRGNIPAPARSSGSVAVASERVAGVSPGSFGATCTGDGVAAADLTTIRSAFSSDGGLTFEPEPGARFGVGGGSPG